MLSEAMLSSSSTPNSTNFDLNPNYNWDPDYYLHDHTQIIPGFENSDPPPSQNDEIALIDAAGGVDCGEAQQKTVDDLWREIVAGGGSNGGETIECKTEVGDEMVTLEDFLARATAEEEVITPVGMLEEEVKAKIVVGEGEGEGEGMYGYGNHGGVYPVGAGFGNGSAEQGRRKRGRGSGGVMMEPLDKVAQQRQKRMIKNRESAARSRERKQAYQDELEALAAKLEEENERLLREKADRTKQRYMQLMEKVVPVLEKRKPPRTLRRVGSM